MIRQYIYKYYVFTFLVILSVFCIQAQDYDMKVPHQEKVYLHFDHAGYFLKETMWFKAYVLDESNRPTDISKVLYVELVSPEGGVLETRKYKIEQGMCHGDIYLDSVYLSGLFEVRAYTRYMRNFGEDNYFTRVFPVYDYVENGAYHYRTMFARDRDKSLTKRWEKAMNYKTGKLKPKDLRNLKETQMKVGQHYSLFTPAPILCDSVPIHVMPGEKVELTFRTTPNSTFSLSVTDADKRTDDHYHHDIYHTLFLDTTWIGRTKMALLDFNPDKDMFYAPEQKITIDGKVQPKAFQMRKRQREDIPIHLTCNMNGTFIKGKTKTDKWGRWAFETDSLYGEHEAILYAEKTDGGASFKLKVHKWFSPEARPYTEMEKNMGAYVHRLEEPVEEDSTGAIPDIRDLEEITIKGNRKKLFSYAKTSLIRMPYIELMERIMDDGYKEMYGVCSIAEYLFGQNGLPPGCARAIYVDKNKYPGHDKVPVRIEGSPVLDENWFLPDNVKEIIVRTDPLICQYYDYASSGKVPAGGRVKEISYSPTVPSHGTSFLTSYKKTDRQWIYKNGNANHVRYVVCLLEDTSRRDSADKLHYLNNDAFLAMGMTKAPSPNMPTWRKTYVRGYTRPGLFRAPDYNRSKDGLAQDFRRTLYWNPDVRTDENGIARVTFYNNSSTHALSISAEGIGHDMNPIIYKERGEGTSDFDAAVAKEQALALGTAGIDTLYNKVKRFGEGIPQEKVYLHIDNTCYFVGDTIWYKGYVTRSDKGTLTDLSKILYVELLTPDGYLVERQQLEMPGGTACGAFVLTDSLYAGYYELRAYTRWMLSFGQYEHPHTPYVEDNFYNKDMAKAFFRDYEKLYSRVFPVYDKPREEGRYTKDMTCRPMRRYYKDRKGKPELSLKFYPEGGRLIAGTSCRVAFELNSEEGEHLDAELFIQDKDGKEVARTSTVHRGRNVFTLPDVSAKADYRAVFHYGEYDYEVRLPAVEEDGISMRAVLQDSTLHVSMERSRGLSFENGLALHVMCGGVSKAYRKVSFVGTDTTAMDIPLKALPTGVNQLTLYDGGGRVYAERLVFVNHHEHDSTRLAIHDVQSQYAPYEPIELHLKLSHPMDTTAVSVSLSVRDRSTEEHVYDDGTILTEMLLGSELKGFVENPGYYFEHDDSIHRRDLDLLMMVQGWRRYEWRKMAGTEPFSLAFLPEKFQTLRGSVHQTYSLPYDNVLGEFTTIVGLGPDPIIYYTTVYEASASKIHRLQDLYSNDIKKMKKDVNVVASFVQGTHSMELMQMTEGGRFYMQTPKLYGDFTLSLMATDSKEPVKDIIKKQRKDYTDETQYPDYYVKLDHFYPVFPKPYGFYRDASPSAFYEPDDLSGDTSFTNRRLSTVTIRRKRGGQRKIDLGKPAVVIDAYDAYNLITDYGMNCGMHDWRTFSHQVATAFVGDMGMGRHYFLQERFDGRPLNNRPITNGSSLPDKIAEMGTVDYQKVFPEANLNNMQLPSVEDVSVLRPAYLLSPYALKKYHRLRNLDKLYIYTDYAPREQGSWKYEQSNQPDVNIDYRLFPDEGYQHTFRDRHLRLRGYSVCDDFYSPDYSRKPLPEQKDYRRTLLWVPEVKFDENGEATVHLYNNGKATALSIEAEGITEKGNLIKTME